MRNAEEVRGILDIRTQLGFAPSDIVCVYTGRFGADKNPLLLAKAIARLREPILRFGVCL